MKNKLGIDSSTRMDSTCPVAPPLPPSKIPWTAPSSWWYSGFIQSLTFPTSQGAVIQGNPHGCDHGWCNGCAVLSLDYVESAISRSRKQQKQLWTWREAKRQHSRECQRQAVQTWRATVWVQAGIIWKGAEPRLQALVERPFLGCRCRPAGGAVFFS